MLLLDSLTVGYPGTRGAVLKDVSLEAKAGDFICLLGRNGAGKSTLMRTIAGLQPALAGVASLGNDDIAAMRAAMRAQKIAVVLTERSFSPGLKVEDVVTLGRQPFTSWQGHLVADDWRLSLDALKQAGADAFQGRYFDDLSDGEKQRVMIARALAQAPQLMILDEITAFLDLPGRVEVMTLLRRNARDRGAIVLLSSHDLELSLQLADHLWLVDGSGVLQSGIPDALMKAGAINSAFDSGNVVFSQSLGRFEICEAD